MTPVRILLEIPIAKEAGSVYAELCNWAAHSDWVPLTRVDVLSDGEFVAYTGVGPLVLKDHMRIASRNDTEREVLVEKLGPVLKGTVLFRVESRDEGCLVVWDEKLQVPVLPRALVKPIELVGSTLFRVAFRRFAKSLPSENRTL